MPISSQTARSVTGIAASMKIDEHQRKALENTRYSYVGPVVNTGRTAKQVVKKVDRPLRYGEIFRRMSSKELHDLMLDNLDPNESIFQLEEGVQGGDQKSEGACQLGRPSGSHVVCVEKSSNVEGLCDHFLLLDLRSVEAFNRAHISKARSYPSLQIRRDKMTVELTRFKQAEKKPVIVYSDNEKEATEIGTLLIQKHFPNIYVLSSSFEKYAFRFPEDIVGDVPKPPKKTEKKRLPLNVYVPKRVVDNDVTSQGSVRGTTVASSVVSSAPWRPA